MLNVSGPFVSLASPRSKLSPCFYGLTQHPGQPIVVELSPRFGRFCQLGTERESDNRWGGYLSSRPEFESPTFRPCFGSPQSIIDLENAA